MKLDYSAVGRTKEKLEDDGWTVFEVNGGLLATKDDSTMRVEVADHGRDTEEILTECVENGMTREELKDAAKECLTPGYTAEGVAEAIDVIWTNATEE